jgi:hypothetical protein
LTGKFIKSFLENSTENNILGSNDYFILNQEKIQIPETKTTNENLLLFNAHLIKPNEVFNFKCKKTLPIFEVTVGKNYVNGYLLEENFGNGFYIEKHNTPHYHQPLSPTSSGFLVLGILSNEKLVLTKFAIPFGYGIYMEPNTFHSDACLVGDYAVIYTKTSDYSTWLFRTKENKIVQVE